MIIIVKEVGGETKMSVRNACNKAINRCRDCSFWEKYDIPCGNRMGKCKNENSFFFNRSMSQYSYKCEEERLK